MSLPLGYKINAFFLYAVTQNIKSEIPNFMKWHLWQKPHFKGPELSPPYLHRFLSNLWHVGLRDQLYQACDQFCCTALGFWPLFSWILDGKKKKQQTSISTSELNWPELTVTNEYKISFRPIQMPYTEDWIKTMWYIRIMEYYLAIKNEILPLATKWIQLETNTLN